MNTNPYDKLFNIYDSMYYYPVHKLEDDFISKMILSNSINLGKTLDLGCGTAKILDDISFDEYTGIDISPKIIDTAKKKYPDKSFLIDDMSYLAGYPESNFDNIISLFGSFSYSRQPINTIKNIQTLLKPGGQFLIMAYGRNYPKRKTYILNKLKIHSPAKFFSPDELLNLFAAKFTDIEISGMTYFSEYLQDLLSKKTLSGLFSFENNYLKKYLLNKYFFLIITGKKHA